MSNRPSINALLSRISKTAVAATLVVSLSSVGVAASSGSLGDGMAGAAGSDRGLVVLAKKALALPLEGVQVIDNAAMIVENGKVVRIARQSEVDLEALAKTHEILDRSNDWLSPGLIDLHSHVAGASFFTNDLNDSVYLTNPGIRAWTSVVPENTDFLIGSAAGVTSVLYIPGSGTNIGGQGVLLKTGFAEYERMEIRNPGSLKLAQAGNPESFLLGVGRSFMNWNARNTLKRGIAYAKAWNSYEKNGGEKPKINPMWGAFRGLADKTVQVSAHTQIYQVVLMTVKMVKEELGIDVYIDHGSFDGWRAASEAEKAGVPAILGPRAISSSLNIQRRQGLSIVNNNDGAIFGMAAKYQEEGHTMIGFNTDAPVIPQEALPLQASMGVRYGFNNDAVEHIRGLTIVPATAAGMADRVGSLEPGKDADFILSSGDPTDPRSMIHLTFQEGEKVYDALEGRRF